MRFKSILSLLSILLIPLLTQSLWAKGAKSNSDSKIIKLCKNRTNLARKQWTVRTGVPVLSQGPQRMCYAHAASSYLDVWRAWHIKSPTKVWKINPSSEKGGISTLGNLKIKKQIGLSSPYWLGFLAKTSQQAQTGKRAHNLNDGSGELALDVIARGLDGVCREDVMANSLKDYTEGKDLVTVEEFYNFTAWFFDRYNPKIQAKMTRAGISVSRSCLKRAGVRNQKRCDKEKAEQRKTLEEFYKSNITKSAAANALISSFIKKAKIYKIWGAMKPNLKKKSYLPFFAKVFYKCSIRGNKYRETSPETMSKYKVCSTKVNRQSLDFMLRKIQNKEPLGANYYAEILSFKKSEQVPRTRDRLHQSVIIGNRVRNNTCQILVQNSWGNYCGYAWECQKDKFGNELGVWVDSHEILEVMESIFYFEKKDVPCHGEEKPAV